jgi:hypothetical protein
MNEMNVKIDDLIAKIDSINALPKEELKDFINVLITNDIPLFKDIKRTLIEIKNLNEN